MHTYTLCLPIFSSLFADFPTKIICRISPPRKLFSLHHRRRLHTINPGVGIVKQPNGARAQSFLKGDDGRTVVCRCRNTTQVRLYTMNFYYTSSDTTSICYALVQFRFFFSFSRCFTASSGGCFQPVLLLLLERNDSNVARGRYNKNNSHTKSNSSIHEATGRGIGIGRQPKPLFFLLQGANPHQRTFSTSSKPSRMVWEETTEKCCSLSPSGSLWCVAWKLKLIEWGEKEIEIVMGKCGIMASHNLPRRHSTTYKSCHCVCVTRVHHLRSFSELLCHFLCSISGRFFSFIRLLLLSLSGAIVFLGVEQKKSLSRDYCAI